MNLRHDDEFERLLSKVADGGLTEDDRRSLDRLLTGDEVRKRHYFDWISTHVLLESEGALRAEVEQTPIVIANSAQPARSKSYAERTPSRRTSSRLAITYPIAAAVAAIAVGWLVFRGDDPDQPLMATVVDAIDVVGAPQELTQEGAVVDVGLPLEFETGIVAMRMPSGVEFTLQGPASLLVRGENRVALNRGRLYAKVPPEGVGFAVETGAAELVDLGTEFGVIVDRQGAVDAYVYRGAVSVQTEDRSETLREGMAISATSHNGLTAARNFRPQGSDLFTRSVDATGYLAALERLNPLYLHRFSPNSKLRRFGSTIERERSAVSLRGGVYASAGGPIATPDSPDGCLRFVGVESTTVVDSVGGSLGSTEAYTIVAWVRVSEPGPQGLVAFTSDSGTDVDLGPIVRLTKDGFLEHRCHARGEPGSFVSQRSKAPVPRRQWTMIAASGGSNRDLRLYLNGRSVAEASKMAGRMRADCGQLALGSGSGRSFDPDLHTGPLRGAIDEVVVFDYELSEEEIGRLYRLALESMPARST